MSYTVHVHVHVHSVHVHVGYIPYFHNSYTIFLKTYMYTVNTLQVTCTMLSNLSDKKISSITKKNEDPALSSHLK